MLTRNERFSELFLTHYTNVRAYAARRVGEIDADDIASETFSIAFRRLDDLPEHELTWLLAIARKTIANLVRARARRAAATVRLEAEQAYAPVVGQVGDTDQEPSATLIALQSLPERDQEILRLVAWDDLSVGDAAEVLGCSKTNAAVRLHRARGRIRRALAAQATG